MATLATQPLLRLLRYGKPHRLQLGGAITNSILNTLFELAPPCLIGIAIDIVIEQGTHVELLMLNQGYANLWHVQSGDS